MTAIWSDVNVLIEAANEKEDQTHRQTMVERIAEFKRLEALEPQQEIRRCHKCNATYAVFPAGRGCPACTRERDRGRKRRGKVAVALESQS